MMTIALWHDLSIALVIFGTLHGGAMVLGRMIAARKEVASRTASTGGASEHWLRRFLGWFRTYSFLMLTAPLLIINESKIISFYESLLGWRP